MKERSQLSQLVRIGALTLLACGLLLTIIGGRWEQIHRFGCDVPEWDQWDAEGMHALLPWLTGQNLLGEFVSSHNEHRVVLTKVTSLATLLLNGQWDQRLQAALNSLLPASIAVAAGFWAIRRFSARWSLLLFLLLSLGWAGPLAWHNVLAGFHSQQFFLIGLSLVALALLPAAVPFTPRWWVGASASVLALGSMGTGFFAAAGVVGLILLRHLRCRESLRPLWPTLALGGFITAVGLLTRVDFAPHAFLKAKSLEEIFAYLINSLSWPDEGLQPWSAVFWLPWCMLFFRWLRQPRSFQAESDLVLLGVGGWVLLQLVATAIMRGGGGVEVAPRYADTLLVGLMANAFALLSLLTGSLSWKSRAPLLLLLSGWLALFLHGASLKATHELQSLKGMPEYREETVRSTRSYLVRRDPAVLKEGQIPYPDETAFRYFLDIKAFHPYLPASVALPPFRWEAQKAGPFRALVRPQAAFVSLDREERPGLPSTIKDWSAEPTWSSYGSDTSGEFRSVPVKRAVASLRLDVAGTWKESGVALEIRHARTDDLLQSLVPERPEHEGWQPLFFTPPSEPFVLVARDNREHGWLAFTAPRVENQGSRLARLSTALGLHIFWIGVAMGLSAGLVLIVWPAPLSRRPAPTA